MFDQSRSIYEIPEGIGNFINGNYTGDLPADAVRIFPYDLYYITTTPFQADCDDPAILYSSYDDRVGYGLLNVFIMFLSWEIFQVLIMRFNTCISLFAYSSFGVLGMYIYYYTVYGFNPFCTGSQPSMLINDFLVWLDREVFLSCFCAYIPSLSKQVCAQQNCDTCDASTEYHSCHDVATGFTDLNVIWHFVFLFRWVFPEYFAELGNSNVWPLPYLFNLAGMDSLLEDINGNKAVTNKEKSCFYYNILTPISVVLLSYLALLAAVPFVRIAVKVSKETIMILVYLFLALINFAKTLDY